MKRIFTLLIVASTLLLFFSCEESPTPGIIEISSNIDNAYIYIDEELLTDLSSATGAISASISPGNHEITAYKKGYDFQVVSMSITEGEILPVTLTFTAVTAHLTNDFESETVGAYIGFDSTDEISVINDGSNNFVRAESDGTTYWIVKTIYKNTLSNFVWEFDSLEYTGQKFFFTVGGYTFCEGEEIIYYYDPQVSGDGEVMLSPIPFIPITETNHRIVVLDNIVRYYRDNVFMGQFEDKYDCFDGIKDLYLGAEASSNDGSIIQVHSYDLDNVYVYPSK